MTNVYHQYTKYVTFISIKACVGITRIVDSFLNKFYSQIVAREAASIEGPSEEGLVCNFNE